MEYLLFKIEPEQHQKVCLGKEITVHDIRVVMQVFSPRKIKEVKIGKLRICNQFFPSFKESELAKAEGHYVFYAVEKTKAHFYSKAERRIFIWPLYSNSIFVVSPESCEFEKISENSAEIILLEERKKDQVLCTRKAYEREHYCVYEKMLLSREYSVQKDRMVCIGDFDSHYYRWTDQDGWVRPCYVIDNKHEPMFFLRNEACEIKSGDIRISYPDRPPLWGHEIDE